jgi:hypothetical protein
MCFIGIEEAKNTEGLSNFESSMVRLDKECVKSIVGTIENVDP